MKYEILALLKPENTEEQVDLAIEKMKKNIEAINGNFVDAEKWGKRETPYAFKKYKGLNEAYYVLINFEKEQGELTKLDYNIKIDENVVRHMITKKD
ncbi:MAG: 30S ribosomal protein S6 [Candidatus Margulisbacteria bacterium]|nr:30S ribosomal protein S6 [Candidatus Margulisiibacteriota bacterium]